MAHPTGESKDGVLKLDFDRRLMVQFRDSVVTSDAGLLAYRELDDALGLSAVAAETLADTCTGKNGCHAQVGLLRQSVFGRLAGVLAAAVGVMQQSVGLTSTPDGHHKSIGDELRCHRCVHRPTDHTPREQIDDGSDIEPAFHCPDIGEVGNPFAIR
jgi:Transposase DDE domain group 1